MKASDWYAKLVKPSWAPPAWLFSPVWTALYTLIFISYSYVVYLYYLHKIPFVFLLPFILNVIFNLLFTPIQFGLRNNALAAVDVLLVLITLIWSLAVIYPLYTWVAVVNLPYLVWVCFATILQLTVTSLNRKIVNN